jgi:DNA-3-methyladenine glycosylase I
MLIRCSWAGTDELLTSYHDNEWGVPLHEDNELFGFLILEGAQAGLSWQTILRKRDNYRKAFADFDPQKVAEFSQKHINKLLQDQGIVRNRLKVHAAVNNAQKFLEIQKEFGSFNAYQWRFVGNKAIQNNWKTLHDLPVDSREAIAFSKDLVTRGFKFVGPTIVYSHMQATGMVNDHVVDCFRHDEVSQLV